MENNRGMAKMPFAQRFWTGISIPKDTHQCWEWKRWRNTTGYGMMKLNGIDIPAHRASYEFLREPIPPGLVLDHLCRNHGCVNPFHLEAVTHRENVLRGIGTSALNARKTHCNKGHEFTPDNTRILTGVRKGRGCRICQREWDRNKRRAELEAKLAAGEQEPK